MAASILTSETLTLTNVPSLADINTLAQLLGRLGVAVDAGSSDLPIFDGDGQALCGDKKYKRVSHRLCSTATDT